MMTATRTWYEGPAIDLLRGALVGIAPDPAEIDVVSSTELTSAIGRRRVVQYLVAGLDPAGPVQLVAKIFVERRRAELLWTHLHVLSGGPFAVGRFRVPEPMAFLPAENLVLYRAGTGVPLDQLEPPAALEGARDAARWLATLHTASVEFPRSFDETQEVANGHAWADVIGRHRPEVAAAAHRLAAEWAMVGPSSRPAAYRPIHKDFHPGHVLVGDQVCVIDLDEARQGDPAFDLAHFCAYLDRPGDQGASRRAFLAEYRRCSGWTDDGSFARYSAYTWLKIAKQLTLRSGPYRTGGQGSGQDVADAVSRGLACLGR